MNDDYPKRTMIGPPPGVDPHDRNRPRPKTGRPPAPSDPITRALTQALGTDYDRAVTSDWDDGAAAAPPPPPAIDSGQQMGAYTIEALLGRGGMASVYRARRNADGGIFAVKVLNPEFQSRLEVVDRFFQEARAVGQARHPNILEIIELVTEFDHPPFIVMELLEGEDLAHYLHREAPLPPGEAAALAEQMCDAVVAIHQLGIVHRDLKPENIFLTTTSSGPQVKLLDFGIAKFLNADDSMLKTRAGSILGTAQYMAPEQARGQLIDHRVDIYAIGAILYQMLTGVPPFQSNDVIEVLRAQLEKVPVPPSKKLAERGIADREIPGLLEEVTLRCLAKERSGRIQTAGELKALIHQSTEQTAVIAPPPIGVPAPRKGRWPVYAAVAFAAALIVALIAWVASG